MYRKLLIIIVVITCALSQLAQGINESAEKCYSCNSVISCKEPAVQLCDESSANKTQNQLKSYFRNIPYYTNNKFQCLNTSYIDKNITFMSVAGCIYQDLNPCTLKPLNSFWISQNGICNTCFTNLCTSNVKFPDTTYPKPTTTTTISTNSGPKPGDSSSNSFFISSYCIIGIILMNVVVT